MPRAVSWKEKDLPLRRKPCDLEPEVKYSFSENFSPLNIYKKVVKLDNLVELLISQTNICSQQSGSKFLTMSKEINTFFGLKFIMEINEQRNGKAGSQHVFPWSHFQNILPNLFFANNDTTEHADKTYMTWLIITDFNNAFIAAFSDDFD